MKTPIQNNKGEIVLVDLISTNEYPKDNGKILCLHSNGKSVPFFFTCTDISKILLKEQYKFWYSESHPQTKTRPEDKVFWMEWLGKEIIIHGKTESSMSGDIRYRRHKLKTKIRRLNFYIKTH